MDRLTRDAIGAARGVYRSLGPGPLLPKLGGLRVGLLINFNVPELRRGIKCCINSSCILGALGALGGSNHTPELAQVRRFRNVTMRTAPKMLLCVLLSSSWKIA